MERFNCSSTGLSRAHGRQMSIRSRNRRVFVLCAGFLLGVLVSTGETGEVRMRGEQNVKSQEQATRTTIDFNEGFNRHNADAWQRF
jgi:hypothetical protein